jgi:hypothetical protein
MLRSTVFLAVISLLPISGSLFAQQVGRGDPKLFEGAPATMAPDIFGDRQRKDGVLRVLTIDERVGYARKRELVRVPLFFHAGECADPNALNIVPMGGGQPVAYQADDIRRDATGKVARMHVYFYVDLPAWGRKQFNVLPGKNPAAREAALPITEKDGKVTLAGERIKVTFHSKGPLAGTISAIETPEGKVAIPDQNLGPETIVFRQNKELARTGSNEISYLTKPDAIDIKELRWASGSVFSKLILKLAPKAAPDDIAEYQFVVPKYGSQLIATQLFYPAQKDSSDTVGAKGNAILAGKFFLGDASTDQEVVSVPAGLQKELRSVFKVANNAIVNSKAGFSLLMIPYVQAGAAGIKVEPDGKVAFRGSPSFSRAKGSNSDTLRVFWGQVRFIFSKATTLEELWALGCQSFQPLTAVVDEPWAVRQDFADLAKQARSKYRIKGWNPSFEAKLALGYISKGTAGLDEIIESAKVPDLRQVLPTQEAIDKAAKAGGKGAHNVDPYEFTYSLSGLVPFSAFVIPSEKLDQIVEVRGLASRLANGQVSKFGWPYIRSFANAGNMHQGTYLCGLWGGEKTGDRDFVQWCRDAATGQAYRAVYGHGQRPYSINENGGGPSDQLYMSVTDMWLRAMELTCNEDMGIHPSVYGRYFDCIDVNSDIYQRKITETGSEPSWWRAMMFRGQAHDHRWELFTCDPFVGMLGKASDQGKVGLTEACYYMQGKMNMATYWNSVMTDMFFPVILLTKGLVSYRPPVLPPLPGNVKTEVSGGKNVVTWDAVPEVAGYRIYRAKAMGGPWIWVNSPYAKMPPFKAPSADDRKEVQAAAAVEDEAKAKALGVEIAKLTPEQKSKAWQRMPKIEEPSIPDTLIKETKFEDPSGADGDVYFVTAQNKDGRESSWFPDEPRPTAWK